MHYHYLLHYNTSKSTSQNGSMYKGFDNKEIFPFSITQIQGKFLKRKVDAR